MSNDDERDPRTLDAGGVAAFLRERGFAPDTVASVRCVGLSGAQLLALTADDLADEELGLEPDEAAKLARAKGAFVIMNVRGKGILDSMR